MAGDLGIGHRARQQQPRGKQYPYPSQLQSPVLTVVTLSAYTMPPLSILMSCLPCEKHVKTYWGTGYRSRPLVVPSIYIISIDPHLLLLG